MARWRRWAASALGAATAGAGLAALRRRAPAGRPDSAAPPPDPRQDPSGAIDAARARLRARADERRRGG